MRFPEFSEVWKHYKVCDVLDFYSTNSLSWEQLDYGEQTLLNLHYGLIHVGLPILVNLKKETLPSIKRGCVPSHYELCKSGDIAFADASEDTNDVAKAIEFVDTDNKNVVCGLHTIHGRDNKGITVNGFKGYAFASPAFHHQIRRIAQGTKIFSISTKNFSECSIGIPSKAEQEKIAKLLSLVDERLITQSRAIEKLQSLMKGLNNYLQDHVEKEITLSFSEMGSDYSGLTGKTADDFGSGKPFIPYTNVYANTFIDEKNLGSVSVSEGEKQSKVQKGDVVFTLSSETPKEVCYGSVYWGEEKELYLNSFCFGVHITNEKVFPPYLAYFVNSNSFRKAVFPLAQGSTRYNLQKLDFLRKPFPFPSLENQKRIFLVLNAIDKKIHVEQRILESYHQQKSFLLRMMFI